MIPVGGYDIVYLDPPWRYRNVKTGGSMVSGAAAKYDTMSVDELCAFPIHKVAAKNSVIFLWVPTPLKPEAFDVIKAWGQQTKTRKLRYKTTVYWHKVGRLGLGFWFRGEVEELWVITCGKVPAFRSSLRNHVSHPVLRHSEKPPVFREMIDQVTDTDARKIELFARKTVPGWDVWGNEVDGVNLDL